MSFGISSVLISQEDIKMIFISIFVIEISNGLKLKEKIKPETLK
jgi:hypothetical protein